MIRETKDIMGRWPLDLTKKQIDVFQQGRIPEPPWREWPAEIDRTIGFMQKLLGKTPKYPKKIASTGTPWTSTMVPGSSFSLKSKTAKKGDSAQELRCIFSAKLRQHCASRDLGYHGLIGRVFWVWCWKTALKFDVFSQRTRQWVQKNGQVDERSIFRHTLWRDELICFQRFQPQIRGVWLREDSFAAVLLEIKQWIHPISPNCSFFPFFSDVS